jgi:hypothetical protein
MAARQQARHLPESEGWLRRIEEIERLGVENGASVARLVGLLQLYADAERESDRVRLESVDATGRAPTPRDLYAELARLAHWALRVLGSASCDDVVRAYSHPGASTHARRWLLLTLSEIADPQLEPLFRELADHEELAQRGLTRIEARKRGIDPDAEA